MAEFPPVAFGLRMGEKGMEIFQSLAETGGKWSLTSSSPSLHPTVSDPQALPAARLSSLVFPAAPPGYLGKHGGLRFYRTLRLSR